MKTNVILLSLLILCFNGFSQSRQNRESTSFKKLSPELSQANGWKYNDYTGVWISNRNLILSEKDEKHDRDFDKIQIGKITENNTDYYVLLFYITTFHEKNTSEIKEEKGLNSPFSNEYLYTYKVEYKSPKISFFILNEIEYRKLVNTVNSSAEIDVSIYPKCATGAYCYEDIVLSNIFVNKHNYCPNAPNYDNNFNYNNIHNYDNNLNYNNWSTNGFLKESSSPKSYDEFSSCPNSNKNEPYDQLFLLGAISQKIRNDRPSDYCILINSQYVDGKYVVRFSMPKRTTYSGFQNEYFEVSKSEFQKLLID